MKLKSLVLAGAVLLIAAPAFAQVPMELNPLGVDLDPLHIFTPAPMAPPAAPMMHKKMHHKMMMKKKKMMMKK